MAVQIIKTPAKIIVMTVGGIDQFHQNRELNDGIHLVFDLEADGLPNANRVVIAWGVVADVSLLAPAFKRVRNQSVARDPFSLPILLSCQHVGKKVTLIRFKLR